MQFVDSLDNLWFKNGELTSKDDISFENFSFLDGFFNLKVFMTFFKIKDENFEEKKRLENQIKACFFRFNDFNVDISNLSMIQCVPFHIIEKYAYVKNNHYSNIINKMKTVNNFNQFLKFYKENNEIFNILPKLKQDFDFGSLEFDFAENFRFKTCGESFNILNLRKDLRDIIKPLSDDYFVFVCDYKQFEFRTLLNLLGYDKSIFCDNLYEILGKRFGLSAEDAKQSLIAWMYSDKKNVVIDTVLDKAQLISKLHRSCFSYEGVPVFAGNEEQQQNKKIHSIVQTYSQFFYLKKLNVILKKLENKKSIFVAPLHDSMIFFIHKTEKDLCDEIPLIMETDVYKIKKYIGKNFKEIEEV